MSDVSALRGRVGKEAAVSTLSHPPTQSVHEQDLIGLLRVREIWASLAIIAMWIAVACSAAWGPDFVSTTGSGTNTTTIPSGIAVALFASIGTWAVAKYGLSPRKSGADR
jgi:hypothetical protein